VGVLVGGGGGGGGGEELYLQSSVVNASVLRTEMLVSLLCRCFY